MGAHLENLFPSSPSGNERQPILTICKGLVTIGLMEANVDQLDLFPWLASGAKTERSAMRQYLELTAEHGPLVTAALAAETLGVSRQRVHQLVNEDRIATVRVAGHRMIPAASLNLFMSEERGRSIQPKNQRKGLLRTLLAEANQVAERLT